MDQTFMKEKKILPLLLSMGVPMIISMMANSMYNIVDSMFVAKISEDAMTALSLVFPAQNLVNAIAIGFAIGINAVIARSLGEGKRQKADMAASQGFVLNLIHGLFLTISCLMVMPFFLKMFTADEKILDYGLRYSNIIFCFSMVIAAALSFEKIFQSVGRMVTSMASMLLGCIVNLILDPLMIFGIGPFPAMGIEGAAWATGIGQAVSVLCYVIIYKVNPIPVKLSFRHLSPDRKLCVQMYSVGIAAALNLALPSILISALNAILAPFSQVYVLVLGVYYKLQALLYHSANGLIQGMRPVIAYNYGAGEKERVWKIYRITVNLVAGIMLVGTILCLGIPRALMGLFTENPATVLEGAKALRIICVGFLPSSISVVSSCALEGLGKGFPSFVISLLRYTVIIIPCAFLLSRFVGVTGVWHAFWISEVITFGCSGVIFLKSLGSSFYP